MANHEGVGPYRYSSLPLNHIRLLQLEPSSDPSRPLRYTLSDFDLQSSDIPYTALSYVWGPPVFDQDLHVGDDAVLWITSSLHGALKRLRRDSRPRRVWADSVRINQASDEEKRVQIPLMRSIYQGANAVFVWLGEGDQAASALHYLSLQARRLTLPGSGLQKEETVLATKMVDQILSLPWFKRRWIIQELALNVHVLFCAGTAAELEWTKFMASMVRFYPDTASQVTCDGKIVQESPSGPPVEVTRGDGSASVQISSVNRMFELWKERALPLPQSNNIKCGLLALLREFDENACSNARDRIYALTGLANDVSIRLDSDTPNVPHGHPSQISMRMSYSQSIESAYVHFAEDLISSGRISWLLEQAIARRPLLPSERNLPLWVPDWRLKPSGTYYDLNSTQRINQSSYRFLPLSVGIDSNHHIISIEVHPWNRFYQNLARVQLARRRQYDDKSAPVRTDPTQRALPSILWRSETYPKRSSRIYHDPRAQMEHEENVSIWLRDTVLALCQHVLTMYETVGSYPYERVKRSKVFDERPGPVLELIATLLTCSASKQKQQMLNMLESKFYQRQSSYSCLYGGAQGDNIHLEQSGSDLSTDLPSGSNYESLARTLDNAMANRCLFVIQSPTTSCFHGDDFRTSSHLSTVSETRRSQSQATSYGPRAGTGKRRTTVWTQVMVTSSE